MAENPRNNCPARHLCEALNIDMGCGSDICPWIPREKLVDYPKLPFEYDDS